MPKPKEPHPMDFLHRSGKDVQLMGCPLADEVNWWWTCQNSYNPRAIPWRYSHDQLSQAHKIGAHPVPITRDRLSSQALSQLPPHEHQPHSQIRTTPVRQLDHMAEHQRHVKQATDRQNAYLNNLAASGLHGKHRRRPGEEPNRVTGAIPHNVTRRWGISPWTHWRLKQLQETTNKLLPQSPAPRSMSTPLQEPGTFKPNLLPVSISPGKTRAGSQIPFLRNNIAYKNTR